MPTNIACPHCGLKLQLPDEFAGQKVRCSKCDAVFVADQNTGVTGQTPASAPARQEIQAGPPPLPARATRPRRQRDAYFDDEDNIGRINLGTDFRPGGGLATAVKALLWLNVAMSILLFGGEYLQHNLAERLNIPGAVDQAEIQSNDIRQMFIGLLHVGAYITCAIVFIIWFHRAYVNLSALGAPERSCGTGWVVGAWFVPFLNLVRPAQIAGEILRGSGPESISATAAKAKASALVGLWWASWLISNIVANISMRVSWAVNSPDSLKAASILGMVSEVAGIVAALFALKLVATIDSWQSERADTLAGT